MELKKIHGNELIQPNPAVPKAPVDKVGGPSFQETLNKVSTGTPVATNPSSNISPSAISGTPSPVKAQPVAAPVAAKSADPVKFSNHAIERMQTRGIHFKPDDMARLNDAVARAAAKGSKDSLILMNDSALIVSVKNKTVVTVMDKSALKENVFTNIDSTIVM